MGLLSVLFGRNKLRKPDREQFFSAVTAVDSLRASVGLRPGGKAGVVFNPVDSSFFQELDSELRELLKISGRATGTRFDIEDDGHGTRWVILDDRDFEDLVATIHLVGETFIENGFGDRLLAAVFRFDFEQNPAYWVYNLKRGKFHPLVLSGETQRDNTAEMRLGALMESEKVPVEPSLEHWYALWGIPF